MKLINTEVRIETTNLCNANCTICPRDQMTRPKVTMSLKHFVTIATQACDMGAELISAFGYGEPLMDKEIVDKIKVISAMGIESFITTNGSLLTAKNGTELIDAGLSHIRFSVHGIGKQYEEVHRNLKWNDTRNRIIKFLRLNEKLGKPVKVDLSFIPIGLYADREIDTIVRGWHTTGIEDIEVWKPHGWAGAINYRELNKTLKTCGRPEKGPVQINADGKMMVCCFDFDGELTVGDTYKDKISVILKSSEFQRIRKKHREGDLEGLICERCDQLNGGDSPLIYSTVDEGRESGRTSSSKFRLL